MKRTAFAEERQTTIVVVGSRPGQAYVVGGWELWAPLNHLYEEGRYAEAADGGNAAIAASPDHAAHPGLLYNLACCESLAGRSDDAIEHLRLSIEGSDRFREYAAEDSDLDALRDESAFKALVAADD